MLTAFGLDQAEDDFNVDPCGDGAAGGVASGGESPGAHGLHGAIIEALPDSLHDLDLRGTAIGSDQGAQRDRSLPLGLASFVGVLRIGAVRAGGPRSDIGIKAIVGLALTGSWPFIVTH